jgi:hypothetical protein
MSNKRPLRRALQAFMVLVVFVIGSFVVIALMPPKRLLAENFPQVLVGMSQTEVETLLGGRAGNYGKYPDGVFVMSNEAFVSTSGPISKDWCDDSHLFQIYFDAQGRVVAKYQQSSYQQLPGPPISHWERFRRWIRLKTGW